MISGFFWCGAKLFFFVSNNCFNIVEGKMSIVIQVNLRDTDHWEKNFVQYLRGCLISEVAFIHP